MIVEAVIELKLFACNSVSF